MSFASRRGREMASAILPFPPVDAHIRGCRRIDRFRFRREYDTTYVLNEGGQSWSCDPAVGKFRILAPSHRALTSIPI